MKLTIDQIKAKLASRGEETFHLLRDMTVNPDTIDKEACTAEFSVSSEFPVLRWFGYEILDHNATSIRMGRIKDGAAHRDGHYGDQIGVIEKSWLDTVTRKLWVKVRFSKNTKRAIEIWGDIVDGIRKNVSIAYDIFDLVLERETDNEAYYRIMDWEPIHTCHTPDGADPTVGNGRSKENQRACDHTNTRMVSDCCGSELSGVSAGDETECPDCGDTCTVEEECRDCGKKIRIKRSKTHIVINQSRSTKMTPEEIAAQEKAAREAREKEDKELREKSETAARDNAASIIKIAADLQDNVRNINLTEKAREFISGNKGRQEFYDYVTAEMKKPEAVRTAAGHVDAGEKALNKYSLRNALLGLRDPEVHSKLGIEREINEELAKRVGRDPRSCVMIPTDVFGFRSANTGNRAQSVGVPGAGGLTVFETPVAQTFVEYLHNQLAFVNAGVTVLDNLTGVIPFVREANQHTFSFKAERVAPDSSDVTFTKETYGPLDGGSLTTLGRRLLLQSENVSEAWARRKLLGAVMRGMDRTIAYGAGGVEPTGFKNMTGPHGIPGAAFNRDSAIDMQQSIIAVNAEIGSFNFVTNPLTAGILKKKQLAANYPSWLWDDNNVMAGRPAKQANQVDEGDLFYGGWSNLILLLWGYIIVEANPYGAGWAAGDIDVKALISMNLLGEHPEAISIAENVN
jgi:HK97 family phage major capsid protein